MALDLRPLTLAELLDRSFSTYKRHLWLFVGIMAVPASIAVVYSAIMQVLQFALGIQQQPTPETKPEQLLITMIPVFISAVLFLIVYMVIYAFALGATTIAVAHLYNDRAVTAGIAYREVRRHGWRLILLLLIATLKLGGAWIGLIFIVAIISALLGMVTPILSGLFMIVGMLLAFVAVAYLGVRYGVSVPAVVLENRTARQALARSVELTEDHRGRVFLLVLCAVVITYATAALLQGPFMMGAMFVGPGTTTALVLSLTGAVLGAIGGMFSGPLMIIGLAMIYYDLRVRKEALDLQMMLEALDTPRA
jgi:hypothetical protein